MKNCIKPNSLNSKQLTTAMDHRMKIMMTVTKMIMITTTMETNMQTNESRSHFSLQSHHIHQFIVCFFFFWIKFIFVFSPSEWNVREYQFEIMIFVYSAAIENNRGNWSGATWSRNWIWLPGRSSGCSGWTKSMRDGCLSTEIIELLQSFDFVVVVEWCTSLVCAGMHIRWPVSTDSMLSFSWLLLVCSWRYWQKHTGHID